jgi:hypothetical protein
MPVRRVFIAVASAADNLASRLTRVGNLSDEIYRSLARIMREADGDIAIRTRL